MAGKSSGRGDLIGRLFNFANNPVTVAGLILTTISGVLLVIFVAVDMAGGFPTPYVAIFAYLILPAVFVAGLLLMPVGMWRRRRRLLKSPEEAEALDRYPCLDFNDPQLRRLAGITIVLTVLNAVIFGTASFLGVEEMETVEFCGTTCHTVMQPEHTAYQQSPHSRVECVECHIGPGASWMVRSKLDGLRQVWRTAWDSFDRPIHTPIENLRPSRDTCEQCHWPAKHHGDKLRVIARFGEDEDNTPSYTVMLLKTGGGSLELGRHGGIHWWHIYSDNRIRYVAADERLEEISWVELVMAGGEVRTYTRDGGEGLEAEEIEREAQTMDCITCHNRPTHLFAVPAKAVDELLHARPELRGLPYFKRESLRAMSAEYATRQEGMDSVREALLQFYSEQWPEVSTGQADLVREAAENAAEVYGRSFFPEMKTSWETHPNHIGHDDFPGCWRCHDGEMATADGEHVIPVDCDSCHTFLYEDEPELPEFAAGL